MNLCVISARGGSQGVPGKNIRSLLGKPVICWAIEKALSIEDIDHVVVSTDSPEIAAIARNAGAQVPFLRPAELANATSGKFQVWQHALLACEEHFNKKCDLYIDIDCTNPLIEISDIKKAMEQFKSVRDKGVDAVFTVSAARRNPYFNLVEPDASGALKMCKSLSKTILSRQKAPLVYEHVAGIYLLKPDYLARANHLLDGHAVGYEVGEAKSFDIDSEVDFLIIEFLLSMQLKKTTSSVKTN